jgi:putative redox protein
MPQAQCLRGDAPRVSVAMECTINWLPASGMAFTAETGSGHMLTMDGSPDGGGRNLAPRPLETVLAGAGACSAYDVVLILKRGRHDVRGCQVQLDAERAAEDPKVFTRIRMHFVVTGVGLPTAAVERAVQLSRDKYCSATAMLAKTAEIATSFEVVAA